MNSYQKQFAVISLLLIFTAIFVRNVKLDFPLIFQRDLLAHDESSNSVVAANLTRKIFPPMIRVNSLNDQQGNWMEGPFWQHIPPLFAYVPYVFFKLDGQVTIEVKRLSYAFITLLTGLLFIFGVYVYRKSLWSALAATIAAIFWISTPFTHELITGYAFGVSDIVLAFAVVGSFCAMLWYLNPEALERREYPYWKLALIGAIVSLPIMAKNLLGAIPAATFFVLLLRDHRAINKKVLVSAGSFFSMLLLYYLPLYFASPQTFNSEIFVSFLHFKQLEGWSRPWHWYVSNYLPSRYLLGWTWVYYLGLILAIGLRFKESRYKTLWLSGGWFLWNLIVVSFVTSKVPNFIYQSYLLSLYFVVYSVFIFIDPTKVWQRFNTAILSRIVVLGLLIVSIFFTGYEIIRFAQQFKFYRAQAYNYQSEHEKFYKTAEELRALNLNTEDLIIVRVSDNDCWFRYYPLFLTGTESKTLLEMYFNTMPFSNIEQKYREVYFVLDKNESFTNGQRIELANYSVLKFDIHDLKAVLPIFLNHHQADIQKDIFRIKKDKASCQWLVPDPILNAP